MKSIFFQRLKKRESWSGTLSFCLIFLLVCENLLSSYFKKIFCFPSSKLFPKLKEAKKYKKCLLLPTHGPVLKRADNADYYYLFLLCTAVKAIAMPPLPLSPFSVSLPLPLPSTFLAQHTRFSVDAVMNRQWP